MIDTKAEFYNKIQINDITTTKKAKRKKELHLQATNPPIQKVFC